MQAAYSGELCYACKTVIFGQTAYDGVQRPIEL
jgi:hypothetical protein